MAGARSAVAKKPRAGSAGGKAARSDAVRSRRRRELIEATIKCIARSGLGAVTMQEITREAGLSLGIVNLHFDTKEKLLVETLRVIAEEYRTGWRRIVDSGKGAAERLSALVDFDFSARVADRNKLAVWFAFWGETKARPTYRRICADVDRSLDDELCMLCTELAEEGGYRGVDPQRVAKTYSALTNGLWLDILVCPQELDRATARAISRSYLAGIFPRHFDGVGTGAG